jgi:HSP20 family protein
VVRADLAGITPGELELEIRGRELVLVGRRMPDEAAGRVYQQVEIEHGPFRRVVSLGVEVDPDKTRAVYQDGILTVELPVLRRMPASRSVPITTPHPDGS